jgi:hypothetical protein
MPSETLFFIYTPAEMKRIKMDYELIDLFLLLHSYDWVGTPPHKTVHWVCDYSMWIHNPNPIVQIKMREHLRKIMTNAAMTLISCSRIEKYLHEADLPIKRVMHFPFIPEDFEVVPYGSTIYTKPVLVIGWLGNASPACHGWLKGLEVIKHVCEKHSDKFLLKYHDKAEGTNIKYSEVQNFYSAIDVYVCYSIYEGSPNTIMEASACGRAWISTDVGEVHQLIEYDERCGIMIERREDVLEEKLLELHRYRICIVDMGQRSKRVIEKYYNYDTLYNNIKAVIALL